MGADVCWQDGQTLELYLQQDGRETHEYTDDLRNRALKARCTFCRDIPPLPLPHALPALEAPGRGLFPCVAALQRLQVDTLKSQTPKFCRAKLEWHPCALTHGEFVALLRGNILEGSRPSADDLIKMTCLRCTELTITSHASCSE
jgi:hypothetical protein